MQPRHRFATLLWLLAFPCGALAQSSDPAPEGALQPVSLEPQASESAAGAERVKQAPVVTLRQVLARAREDPPAILAALATLHRVEAQESYARGAYIPRFSIEGGTGIAYTHQPFMPKSIADLTPAERAAVGYGGAPETVTAVSQTSFGRGTLDYALFDMGRRYAVKSTHMIAEAQKNGYKAAQRSATQAASELYLRAVAAIAFVEDARLTKDRRDTQFQAITGLAKAGLRPSVDATRSQIEVVAARYALETREIELEAAGAALSAAMGGDPTQPLAPAPFDEAVLPAPLDPLRASVQAIERRPEIKQLAATLQARQHDHRAAIGARLPTSGVLAQGNASYVNIYHGDGYEKFFGSANASIYLRWAALDPAIWRRASVTSGAIEEAQKQLETMLLNVRAEVVDAAYTVKRTHALVEQATQILAAAEAARTAQNERYRAGVASLLDLLDAEGVEQNARRQRIEAARDHRIARLRLLALSGTLDELAK
jgi:outer membrane protein